MEKEKKSGYEKYSRWFDTIDKKCNMQNMQQEVFDLEDPSRYHFQGYSHFLLSNGLHVYKHNRSNDMIVTASKSTGVTGVSGIAIMRRISQDGNEIRCSMELPAAEITYELKGMNEDGGGVEQNWAILPRQSKKIRSIVEPKNLGANLPADMRQLLVDALERAEDEETANMYKEGIQLYDMVSDLIKDEKDNNKTSDDQERSQEEQDLTNLSIAELKAVLEKTKETNKGKEAVLKRKLIEQIRAAQEEGQKLDEQLSAENARTNDEREE